MRMYRAQIPSKLRNISFHFGEECYDFPRLRRKVSPRRSRAFQEISPSSCAGTETRTHKEREREKREKTPFRYLGHVSSGPMGAFSRRKRDTRIFVGQGSADDP